MGGLDTFVSHVQMRFFDGGLKQYLERRLLVVPHGKTPWHTKRIEVLNTKRKKVRSEA